MTDPKFNPEDESLIREGVLSGERLLTECRRLLQADAPMTQDERDTLAAVIDDIEQDWTEVVSRLLWKREMAHSSGRMNTTHRPSCRTASGGTRHGRAYQEAAGRD